MQELARSFVPAADEVWRLQNSDQPDCRLFRQFCEEGHYGGREGTRQGIYACTPSGRFLASVNSNAPGDMAAMLRRALERWKAIPKAERLQHGDPAATRIDRAENRYPADGLVLAVHARDLPREGGNGPPNAWQTHAWNVDYAWFSAAEVKTLFPAQVAKGAVHAWPEAITRRLVRLHFVDFVRGQTDLYRSDDVREARISTTVESVKGGVAKLRFEGASRCEAGGEWTRSVETKIYGEATYDSKTGRFTSFEMAAAGTRQGRTRYNFRETDLGPAPIGFALTLAGDAPEERVAPAFYWEYGW